MDMLEFVTPEGIVGAWRVVRLVVVVLWAVWRVAAEALRDGRGSDVAVAGDRRLRGACGEEGAGGVCPYPKVDAGAERRCLLRGDGTGAVGMTAPHDGRRNPPS